MPNRPTAALKLLGAGLLIASGLSAQAVPARPAGPVAPAAPAAPAPVAIGEPDSRNTQRELSRLLQDYPPSVRSVLALDPALLSNPGYLAPYPALAAFLTHHPEIARNPEFYVGPPERDRPDDAVEIANEWKNALGDTEGAIAGILAMCILGWLVRSFMDNRRWRMLAKVQAEAHTKLLDRLTNNEDLLGYINSPAGSKFLQSAPITLDAAPRSNVAAPVGRILWTVQGGVVLIAVGVGLEIVSRQSSEPVQEPIHALGILAAALGAGFVVSAIVSFLISQRLGLLETQRTPANHA